MLPEYYESNELISILEPLLEKRSNGILRLETKVDYWQNQKSSSFILNNGAIIFAGSKIPSSEQLAKTIGKKLNSDSINAALLVAKKKIVNPQSHQEFVNLLVTLKVFSWEDIYQWIMGEVAWRLEIFAAYPGKISWQNDKDFDLFNGIQQNNLDWTNIKEELQVRQKKWQSLLPTIPKLDAIPLALPEKLAKINDAKVKNHLASSANGKNTLLDIAEKIGKDPLKVARIYFGWIKSGLVSFNEAGGGNQNLPCVLSVDDSPIIQTMIKRSLKSTCNVLLADNHIKAMEMLNQHPVKMLLLDLTMPDIDGLEFCRRLREIPKFQELPVVMVTARDGLVNRAKGHFAGTNKYLTKPFKPEELREVVTQLISS